jgi:hypothetical protein
MSSEAGRVCNLPAVHGQGEVQHQPQQRLASGVAVTEYVERVPARFVLAALVLV